MPAPLVLWGLIASLAGLVLIAWVLLGGVLHHAIRQWRGLKHHPQPARAYLEAIWNELTAAVEITAGYPRGRLTDPPTVEHDPEAGPPILLVPGYTLPWTAMDAIADALEDNGLSNVHRLALDPARGPIDAMGQTLLERITEITDATRSPAILVGHSVGGLAARWAYDHGGEGRIAHIVTIGTPHAGTHRARRGLGEVPRQLTPGSRFLTGLDEHPLVASTSLFSHVDNFIVPARSARWGDQAVAIPGLGHLGLIREDRSTRIAVAAVVASLAEHARPEGEHEGPKPGN